MRRRHESPTTALLRAISRLFGVLVLIGIAHIVCVVMDGYSRFKS